MNRYGIQPENGNGLTVDLPAHVLGSYPTAGKARTAGRSTCSLSRPVVAVVYFREDGHSLGHVLGHYHYEAGSVVWYPYASKGSR